MQPRNRFGLERIPIHVSKTHQPTRIDDGSGDGPPAGLIARNLMVGRTQTLQLQLCSASTDAIKNRQQRQFQDASLAESLDYGSLGLEREVLLINSMRRRVSVRGSFTNTCPEELRSTRQRFLTLKEGFVPRDQLRLDMYSLKGAISHESSMIGWPSSQ